MSNGNGSKSGNLSANDVTKVITGWFKYVLVASALVASAQVALQNIAHVPFLGNTKAIIMALGVLNFVAIALNAFIKLVQDTRK